MFTKTPNTSPYVLERGGANDEISIAIIDKDGKITGQRGTVLEKFELLSLATDAKALDGSANYYKEVINNQSRWIFAGSDLPGTSGPMTGNSTVSFGLILEIPGGSTGSNIQQLSGGTLGGTAGNIGVGTSEVQDYYLNGDDDTGLREGGYNLFKNDREVSILIDSHENTILSNSLIDLCEEKKFTIVPIGVRASSSNPENLPEATNEIIVTANNIKSSSRGILVAGEKRVKDEYNNKFVNINHASDVAGLISLNSARFEPWLSPAGLNRGQIRNYVKLLYNPKKAFRDQLYTNRINPVAEFLGEGVVLFGDRTALAKPSAFDRINVRRLFDVVERAVYDFSKYYLFELNDALTRNTFKSAVDGYLSAIKGRGGVYDYKVVCDETNNTAEVVDRNQFVADIFLKPVKSINFIQLNFVAMRTGASFNITE
jgi:hypothetical protein